MTAIRSLDLSDSISDPVHVVHYISMDRPFSAIMISVTDYSNLNNPGPTVYHKCTVDWTTGVPMANTRSAVSGTNMRHIYPSAVYEAIRAIHLLQVCGLQNVTPFSMSRCTPTGDSEESHLWQGIIVGQQADRPDEVYGKVGK